MRLTKIELHKNKKGEFYFAKFAGNGEQITMSSESYTSKENAIKAVVVDTNITLLLLQEQQAVQLSYPYNIPFMDWTVTIPVKRIIRFDANGVINVKDAA